MNIIAQTRPSAPVAQGVNFRTQAPMAQAPAPTSRADLPKANIWLNLGYGIDGALNDKGEPDDGFISLASGVALDTMADLQTTKGKPQYLKKQAARNGLRDQLIKLGNTLKPGETIIVTGLSIQMRRVGDEMAPVLADESNEFAAELVFGAQE